MGSQGCNITTPIVTYLQHEVVSGLQVHGLACIPDSYVHQLVVGLGQHNPREQVTDDALRMGPGTAGLAKFETFS